MQGIFMPLKCQKYNVNEKKHLHREYNPDFDFKNTAELFVCEHIFGRKSG